MWGVTAGRAAPPRSPTIHNYRRFEPPFGLDERIRKVQQVVKRQGAGYIPGVLRWSTTLLPVLFFAGVGLAQSAPSKIPVTGEPQPRLAKLDALMSSFMARNAIPGGVLAVSYKGRWVYDRGFGFADVAKKRGTKPSALFRIASVSKPFTAVAVLQLVERGKLELDDKVFDLLNPEPVGDVEVDPRFRKVTILHLLQHRGGWNRDTEFDPMFRSHVIAAEVGRKGPAESSDVIRYMAGRPLQFEPGEYYCYSNFGYCLLGRVIEKVTGKKYAAFVRQSVLQPLGIRRMYIGATRAEKRREDEVLYYGREWRKARSVFAPEKGLTVPWEYGGFYLEAMDSHGAWLASARDLLRLAKDFDDPKKSKLLKPETIAMMFARPPGFAGTDEKGAPRPVFYACGWMVTPKTQGHGGSLPGTTSKLVRRNDGIHWAVLFNSRLDAKGKRIHPDHFQAELRPVLDAIKSWPDTNLFERRERSRWFDSMWACRSLTIRA